MTVEDDALSVAEVARLCRRTTQTIRNWIDSGRLPAVRIGHRYYVPREAVSALFEPTSAEAGPSMWDRAAAAGNEAAEEAEAQSVWDAITTLHEPA
jgi:excisionase family DNA binding protein